MNLYQFMGALELGLIYGIVALGVYITFRIVDFPDLSVDGTFPLGGAVAAAMIMQGTNPWVATLAAILAGSVFGMITAFLNVRWNILNLLAGILTMTGLYSINLRIMGKPNIALFNKATIFSGMDLPMVLLGVIVAVITGIVVLFFRTDLGLSIRATGVNERFSQAQGINTKKNKILALAMSNGIVALGGALFAQKSGFADVNVGVGTIIIGLASIIIAEAVFRTRSVSILIIGCVVGSIIYRILIALALNSSALGLQATDLKLISAVLISLTMILPKLTSRKGAQ